MTDDGRPLAQQRPWLTSWLILAIVGVVIFLIGVTLGVLSRHPGTVKVTETATVTVGQVPPASDPTVSADSGQFGDGLYQVGVDIAAGNYRTDGGKDCYWERLNNLSGGFTGIIANGEPTSVATVRVLASDKAFSVHGGCLWTGVG